MESRESAVDMEFLWGSITHLENRISTVDTKANILIGVSIAIVAVSGSLAAAVLNSDTALVLEILVAVSAGATFGVAAGVILRCLSLLNPRGSSPERSQGFVYPQPYVLWPRAGQPWSQSAAAHDEALRTLSDADARANLRATQTTLVFLVEAKYRYYRSAVIWTRRLVWLEVLSGTIAIGAHFG